MKRKHISLVLIKTMAILLSVLIILPLFLTNNVFAAGQTAIWFMDCVYFSQLPGGEYSHKGTMNFDVIGLHQHTNVFAPFDCTIVAIYPGYNSGNSVVVESNNKVNYADGSYDYMSLSFTHDEDISDLWVGKQIRQGEVFYQTGQFGNVTGDHTHVSCIRGKYQWDLFTQNQYGKYGSPNAINPVNALFLSPNTNVIETLGLSFKVCGTYAPLSFSGLGSASVKDNNAVIYVDFPLNNYTDAGFYIGKDKDNMVKHYETEKHQGPFYAEHAQYNLNEWGVWLEPGTEYYFKLFVIRAGTEYCSNLAKFTTTGSGGSGGGTEPGVNNEIISLGGLKYPSNVKVGNAAGVFGTVQSPNTLDYVDLYVSNNPGGKNIICGDGMYQSGTKKSFDLFSVDPSMSFSKLQKGTYYLIINAVDTKGYFFWKSYPFTVSDGALTYKTEGRIEGAHNHDLYPEYSWDDGVVTKEATTTEEGEILYTCYCGETKIEKIPKIEVSSCRITFDANGGLVDGKSQIVLDEMSDETISIDKTPVREGFTFIGWYKEKLEPFAVNDDINLDNSKLYNVGADYTITASESLYAVWQQNKSLSKISVISEPTKKTYNIDEKFNSTGLKILLLYNDGSTKTITSGFEISGFDSSSAGQKSIVVTYEGKKTSFTVVVIDSVISDDDPIVILDNAKVLAGKTFSVDLKINNNPGIAGLTVSIVYDKNVFTLENVEKGNMFSGFSEGTNYTWDDVKDILADGKLATFTFTANENAEAGEYGIQVIVRKCINQELNDVKLAAVNSTVLITDYVYGDANDDGVVDVKDVVLIRQYIANYDYDTKTSTVNVGYGADANDDGNIDVQDVVLLRQYIAGYDYDTGESVVILGPRA